MSVSRNSLLQNSKFRWILHPIEFEEKAVIKQIALRVDYVLFDDNTAIGSDGVGERKINLMREGARRYKGLLMRHYLSNGQSFSKVIPLLESRDADDVEHTEISSMIVPA